MEREERKLIGNCISTVVSSHLLAIVTIIITGTLVISCSQNCLQLWLFPKSLISFECYLIFIAYSVIISSAHHSSLSFPQRIFVFARHYHTAQYIFLY